jgi:predicted nuclease of predicted toxin-antitoxin system
VKLLLDHNISHKLVARLADVFPGSTQTVTELGRTNDPQLWLIAQTNDYILVTKDRDVAELGNPSRDASEDQLVRMGNCRSPVIEQALRSNFDRIAGFVSDPERVVLELWA